MSGRIVKSSHNGIGVITIDNPPVNALGPGIAEGIVESIEAFNSDSAISAIVIIGAGKTFIAGADIKEFARIVAGESEIHLAEEINRIEQSVKPVVVAIHGQAFGGGLELAMGGHYRVIARDAKVGQPEVKLGLIPGAAGTQRLPRLAGMEKALTMCWSGDPISAEDAFQSGIVDEIADGNLLEFAVAYASKTASIRRTGDLPVHRVNDTVFEKARAAAIARFPGLIAPQLAIDAVEASAALSFPEGVEFEAKLFQECLFSEQSKAMIHIFFGQREVAKTTTPERIAEIGKQMLARYQREGGSTEMTEERYFDALVEEGRSIQARPAEIDIACVSNHGFPAHLGGPMWRAGIR